MAGRRRGRTGRGWDAAPPRARQHDEDPLTGTAWRRRGGPHAGATNQRQADGNDRGEDGAPEKPVDPAERAHEICLRQLAVRPRTRAELATALRKNGISAEVAAEVLERYGEVGIIDDKAFALAWVTSRHHGRGLARKALAVELRRKGVDADAVGAALDELDPDTEEQTARTLVERKLRTEQPGKSEALFRRLVGVLARKGYPAGLAIRVVKEAIAERAESGSDAAGIDATVFDAASIDADLLELEAADAEAHETN